jgi:chromosome segregation ATPase
VTKLDKEVIAAQDWLKSFEEVASDRKKDLQATELEIEQEHGLMEEARRERRRLEEEIGRLNEEVHLTYANLGWSRTDRRSSCAARQKQHDWRRSARARTRNSPSMKPALCSQVCERRWPRSKMR